MFSIFLYFQLNLDFYLTLTPEWSLFLFKWLCQRNSRYSVRKKKRCVLLSWKKKYWKKYTKLLQPCAYKINKWNFNSIYFLYIFNINNNSNKFQKKKCYYCYKYQTLKIFKQYLFYIFSKFLRKNLKKVTLSKQTGIKNHSWTHKKLQEIICQSQYFS